MPNLLLSVPRVVVARHGGTFVRKTFSRFAIASLLTPIFLTPLAAHPRHHHHFVSVEMMRAATATMTDGTKLHVEIVKMNGHTMVAIPMDDLPDYLHQQLFLPSDR
jgi:hypothetical protein